MELLVILVLGAISSVFGITRPTAIKLENNGYTKVLFAIHQDVAENKDLLDSVKEMLTKASAYMYTATRKRAYFKEVTILVPATWTGSYAAATSEVYTNADVVIEKANNRYGNAPYVRTYSGCGRAGIRVYLTEGFMTMPSRQLAKKYGPRERVLVHEWAHFRWGVFDEYPHSGEQTFYFSPSTGKMEGVRCNIHIYGRNYYMENGKVIYCRTLDPNTGRYPDPCQYLPDNHRTKSLASIMDRNFLMSIVDFCDDDQSNDKRVHNTEAPNKQNRMCGQRSTWAVISETNDFKTGNNPPSDISDTTPIITVLKANAQRRVALLLDTSGSMMNDNKLTRLRQTASNFIMNGVDDDAEVGIMAFSSSSEVLSPMTPVQNLTVRRDLKHSLPRHAVGGTSIGAAVQGALQMLAANGRNASGSTIVILTDGQETVPPTLADVIPEVRDSGASVSIMAFSPDPDDNLASPALMSGGSFYYDSNQATSTSLDDALFDIYATFRHERPDKALQLLSKAAGLFKGQSLSGTVDIDLDIGRDTNFMMTYLGSEPDVIITSPSGRVYSSIYPEYSHDNAFKTIQIVIPEIAEMGRWMYSVSNINSAYQKVAIMVVSRPVDPRRSPVTVETSVVSSSSTWPTDVTIYAEIRKSFHPVTGLSVKAVIDRPFADPVTMTLLDNGAGADINRDDGVYSRYFTKFSGNGRYSVRVEVTGTGFFHSYQQQPYDAMGLEKRSAMYQHEGFFDRHSSADRQNTYRVSRSRAGGVFEIFHSNLTKSFQPFDLAMLQTDCLAPVRITDLKVLKTSHREGTVTLSWTAPGDDFDHYTAHHYEILTAPTANDLINGSPAVRNIPSTGVKFGDLWNPKPAGCKEVFVLKFHVPPLTNTSFVFSVRATDDVGNWGDKSNYATAAFGYVPDYVDPEYTERLFVTTTQAGPPISQKLIIAGVVGSLAVLMLLVIIVSVILYKCTQYHGQKPKSVNGII